MDRRSAEGVRVCVFGGGGRNENAGRVWKPNCLIKWNVIPNCLIKLCDVISRRSGVHARCSCQTMA